MFTPIVLACMVAIGQCAAFGGIAFETEEQCWAHMIDHTVPMVEQLDPGLEIIDAYCQPWDLPGEPA